MDTDSIHIINSGNGAVIRVETHKLGLDSELTAQAIDNAGVVANAHAFGRYVDCDLHPRADHASQLFQIVDVCNSLRAQG